METRKKVWESFRLVDVGHVGDVVQGGGGKLSTAGGDPGENRKETPEGH
jgi:hypothetical protein